MKLIFFIIGCIATILAFLGVVLPILPTTPFLLLGGYCFAFSSKKFENWLKRTKIYQFYAADYAQKRAIPKTKKKKIILHIYVLMGISIIFSPIWWVKVLLFLLTIGLTYYLFKIIPDA